VRVGETWENGEESWIHVPRGQRPFEKGRLGPEGTLHGDKMAKPISVAIVAAFLWIAMLIGLVVGVALLFPGTFPDRMWVYNRPAHAAFQTVGKTSGAGFLVLGLIVGVTAGGLSCGRRWAWWLAILIFALNGIGDLFGLLATRDLLRSGSGLVIAIGFLVVLLRRNVRASFDQPAQ
jgi:hypothetical protein